MQKTNFNISFRQSLAFLVATLMAFILCFNSIALAATLTTASVTVSDSRPSATSVSYDFQASGVTLSSVKCIRVEFDTAANGSGGKPTGLDITSATFSGSSDYVPTPASWSISNNNTTGVSEITYATGETPANASSRNVILAGITNGSTADNDYYLIVNTYDNVDCSTTPRDSSVVQYIYTNGTDVSLTIDPSMTFTVNAVNSGSDVDADDASSENTTVTTTASTVPFSNSVTAGANGIAAQDLTIGTNATNGYNIYMRQTQALTSGGNSIDAVSIPQGTDCTYATPQAFTAAGNEAFGFTTDDADISSGNYQDGAGLNDYCDVTGSNQVVSTRATAQSASETTRVGYQAGISSVTPAGTYTNTIIYTAVPVY